MYTHSMFTHTHTQTRLTKELCGFSAACRSILPGRNAFAFAAICFQRALVRARLPGSPGPGRLTRIYNVRRCSVIITGRGHVLKSSGNLRYVRTGYTDILIYTLPVANVIISTVNRTKNIVFVPARRSAHTSRSNVCAVRCRAQRLNNFGHRSVHVFDGRTRTRRTRRCVYGYA